MLESQPTMGQSDPQSILLASASPRRVQLLALTGWDACALSTEADESPLASEGAEAMARRLAEAKARRALPAADGAMLVLAADTVVTDGGHLLGKPADDGDARQMLTGLRGHTHEVITALALLRPGTGELVVDVCETKVPMRAYTDSEMDAYVASGGPRDKAGAYGIQDADFKPVAMSGFHGCYANVMGLPLCHLVRSMRRLGHATAVDVPGNCQAYNAYACDVYGSILRGEG